FVVYGLFGICAMVNNLFVVYREDIAVRIHGLEHDNSTTYRIIVHKISPSIVYRDSNVTVTAFRVPHGSWKYAFGYHFDANNKTKQCYNHHMPRLRRARARGLLEEGLRSPTRQDSNLSLRIPHVGPQTQQPHRTNAAKAGCAHALSLFRGERGGDS